MVISNFNYLTRLPTAEELPFSDGKPVDSELQDLVPHLLKAILEILWAERDDWFFGIDMGWYYHPEKPAIVPDGFLSLGVKRIIDPEKLRLSYLSWAENYVVPTLTIEVVSKTPGGEYKKKKHLYAELGVPYYVIYAPSRIRKPRLTIYQLINGKYEQCQENPLWIPEIGLAIGTGRGHYSGVTREWLYWYNQQGERYLVPQETIDYEQFARKQAEYERQQAELALQEVQQQAEQERLRAEQAQQHAEQERLRAEYLAEKLRSLGINLD